VNCKRFRLRRGTCHGCTTNLLSITVAEREFSGSKQVLTSVIDGTRREDLGSNLGLQPADQLHVESEWEDFFGR